MDIIQFLDKENIKWFPINVNEKKEPSYPTQYNAKCSQNDFKTITDEEIKYRKQFLQKCNAIAIDTSEVAIIDVDYKDDWAMRKFHKKCFREYLNMINEPRLRETALLILKHNGETLS